MIDPLVYQVKARAVFYTVFSLRVLFLTARSKYVYVQGIEHIASITLVHFCVIGQKLWYWACLHKSSNISS